MESKAQPAKLSHKLLLVFLTLTFLATEVCLAQSAAETVAIYQWWNPERSDNFSTTDPRWTGELGKKQSGYRLFHIGGRLWSPERPAPAGTIPVYSWWDSQRQDNFMTSDPRWHGQPGDRKPPNYGFVRLEGYIADPAMPQPKNTVPVYSWWNKTRSDNYWTTAPGWAGNIGRVQDGYHLFRLEGYALKARDSSTNSAPESRRLSISHPLLPGVETVYAQIADDEALAYGDVLVGKIADGTLVPFANPRYSQYRNFNNCGAQNSNNSDIRGSCNSLATKPSAGLWSGGIVNWSFDNCQVSRGDLDLRFSMTNEEKERIRDALNNVEANTVIDFREISGRNERSFRTPEHLLNFCFDELDSAAGVSPLGFTGVRDQDIRFQVLDRFGNLRNRSTIPRISFRAIYHEVFHALGAVHEHQRPDRDLNIHVNFDNMVSGPIARAAMEVIPGASTITPYDFGSIMHYSPTAFARNESTPTITRRDGSTLSTATRPSAVDYDGINLLYRDIVDGEIPPITAVRQMTLTIDEVESPDEDGGAKTAIDFYAKVEIGANWNWRPGDGANDTQHIKSGTVEEDDNIIHPNWQFSTLLLAGQPLGKASIVIRDDDGLSRNERTDETVDIAEYINQGHVEILVDGNSNRIYLAMPNGEFDADEYLGDIGDPIQLTRGTEGEIRGSITFTVDIHEVE